MRPFQLASNRILNTREVFNGGNTNLTRKLLDSEYNSYLGSLLFWIFSQPISVTQSNLGFHHYISPACSPKIDHFFLSKHGLSGRSEKGHRYRCYQVASSFYSMSSWSDFYYFMCDLYVGISVNGMRFESLLVRSLWFSSQNPSSITSKSK